MLNDKKTGALFQLVSFPFVLLFQINFETETLWLRMSPGSNNHNALDLRTGSEGHMIPWSVAHLVAYFVGRTSQTQSLEIRAGKCLESCCC